MVTSTLVAEGEGVWREYEGSVEDWLTQSARARPAKEVSKASPTPGAEPAKSSNTAPTASNRRKLSYKEQRELEALPAQIEALETEQSTLEKALADGSLYASNPPQAVQMAARLMEVEEQWMAAMERLEALQAV